MHLFTEVGTWMLTRPARTTPSEGTMLHSATSTFNAELRAARGAALAWTAPRKQAAMQTVRKERRSIIRHSRSERPGSF